MVFPKIRGGLKKEKKAVNGAKPPREEGVERLWGVALKRRAPRKVGRVFAMCLNLDSLVTARPQSGRRTLPALSKNPELVIIR